MTEAGAGEPSSTAGSASGTPAVGLFQFHLEGRQAPGLFVVGWLATLLGGLTTGVGVLAGRTAAGAVLFVVGLALLSVGFVLLGGSQAVERRATGLAWAGPSPILVVATCISATLLVGDLVGTLLEWLAVKPSIAERPAWDLVAVGLQGLVFVGVVRIMVIGSGAIGWRDLGLVRPVGAILYELAWGFVLAGPLILATATIAAILVPLLGASPQSPLPPTGTAAGLALHLVAGAAIAPFAEELVFRGVAAEAWTRMGGPRAAIVRSAILFAFAHALTISGTSFAEAAAAATVAVAARFPIALALGWTYLRRRSLWASIGLHATFNGILIIAAETVARNAFGV